MNATQVLLLCGGGGAEHDVSLVSATYLAAQLKKICFVSLIKVEITREGLWLDEQGRKCELNLDGMLMIEGDGIAIDYVVPCLHGFPGETGDIQSLLTLAKLPYMGCNAEASCIGFNKITSKLWFDALAIPNTPYIFLSENDQDARAKAHDAFERWGALFVKAATQGSSVGCYKVTDKTQLDTAIANAFGFSTQVLIEKALKPRELELAAYQYTDGDIVITAPGEVTSPSDSFYSYEEKYSATSASKTTLTPADLNPEQIAQMQAYARKAFVHLKLKDLSRIDFFLTADGEIFLNEINTFPGMTPISMFPKLLVNHGDDFKEFLISCIKRGTAQR